MKQSRLDKILSWIAWAIIIIWILVIIIVPAEANENTNVSGDNTIISGGYTSSSSTTYESGSSSNTTSTSTTNNTSNIKSFPPTASAPPTGAGIDTCNLGTSFGLQSSFIGLSGSSHETDETCERIKLARELSTVHQMKVAAIAILCQDPRVFSAFMEAGTPCPFEGKIAEESQRLWDKYPELRPDYEQYKERMKIKEKIQAEQVMYDTGR